MNNIITISVIIPCYNSAKTIKACLRSVIDQTECVDEIIVVDDGSTDETISVINEVLKNLDGNIKFYLHEQKNAGPSTARNKAIEFSTTSHIAFLDSDDEWYPDHIRNSKFFLKNNYDYQIVATKYLDAPIDLIGDVVFQKLLLKNYFLTPCVVLNKALFLKIDGFNEKMRFAEDYYLWLNIVYANKGYLLDYIGAKNIENKKTFGEKGLSSNLLAMHKGVLKCYYSLYSKNMIDFKTYFKIKNLENIKYLRRRILSFFYLKIIY